MAVTIPFTLMHMVTGVHCCNPIFPLSIYPFCARPFYSLTFIEAQLRVTRQQLCLEVLQSYWLKQDSIVYSSHSDWINFFHLDPSLPYIKQVPSRRSPKHYSKQSYICGRNVYNVCTCETWKRVWGSCDGI